MNYFEDEQSLYFAKLDERAIIPTKNDEDAGYDLYACVDGDVVFQIDETKLIPTKIACAMSPKYYMQIEERSSTGSKGIKKSAGVIDSSYRGEIKVALTNMTRKILVLSNKTAQEVSKCLNVAEDEVFVYPLTKAICEFVILEVPKMKVKELGYEELKAIPSARGVGGFGSSNK